MKPGLLNLAQRAIAVLLCFLLLQSPALYAQQGSAERAGQITALIPAATRNNQRAKVKDELAWKDQLKTEKAGRLRAGLLDGSILSMGNESQLVVVQHNATSQQTVLELNFGRLRSKVAALTRAGSRFEVRSPIAVAGVIGTDFYMFTTDELTIVICYSGRVVVTPRTVATEQQPVDSQTSPNVTLSAGQMVEVRKTGLGTAQPVPADVQQESMMSTDVAERAPTALASNHHAIWIAAAVAMGAAIGIVVGTTGKKSQSSSSCTGHCD
jgi:hypothetical protein